MPNPFYINKELYKRICPNCKKEGFRSRYDKYINPPIVFIERCIYCGHDGYSKEPKFKVGDKVIYTDCCKKEHKGEIIEYSKEHDHYYVGKVKNENMEPSSFYVASDLSLKLDIEIFEIGDIVSWVECSREFFGKVYGAVYWQDGGQNLSIRTGESTCTVRSINPTLTLIKRGDKKC